MQFVTYQGQPLALLLAFPNWDHQITVTLELPTNIDKGLSALESRRVFAGNPRYTLEYESMFLSVDESTRFRLFMQRLKGEQLALPMWPDQCILASACSIGATALHKGNDNPVRFGAEWIIINNDGSQWEIVTVNSLAGNSLNLASGTQYAWPLGTFIYPLFFGRFSERSKIEGITDEDNTCRLKIKENSAYAHRLAPFGGSIPTVGGGVPNFASMPLFNVCPKFDKPVDSTEADVVYSDIGFTRQEQQMVYSQATRRTIDVPFFQASRDEISQIERFFVDRRANARSFMLPTFRNDMKLTADLPQSDPKLVPIEETGKPGAFEDGNRPVNPGDPFVALVAFDLTNLGAAPIVDCQKIASIDGAGLHMLTNISQSHLMIGTLVSQLLLARFTDAKLTWTYKTDGLAETRIKFTELSNEYVTGSAPGVTDPVFIYRFTYKLGTPQYFYFTSFENTIIVPSGAYAGTYVPAPFSHQALKTSVKIDNEKMNLSSWKFSGNPLGLFVPFQAEAELWLDAVELNAADLSLVHIAFTGEIWDVGAKGDEWTASCLIFGRHMERPFPNFNVQKVCNYAVYSPVPRCGVSKPAFAQAGNFTSNPALATTVSFSGGVGKADGYFNLGFIETGTGANAEKRTIMTSTSLGGAGTQLVLNFPLLHAVNGQALNAFPGCDGSKETCKNVFNNLSRMGAFPFVPDLNPTIKAMNAKNAQGGKK